MPSSPTSRSRFEKQGTGENSNQWGTRLNTALELIDEALDGHVPVTVNSAHTLSSTNYASDEARQRFLDLSGTGGTLTIPAIEKLYFIRNGCSAPVTVTTGSGTTAVIPVGAARWIGCDGTHVRVDSAAGDAAASASAAASSAAAASTSAANAAGSASTASSSATNAAGAATAAASSAGAASTSASNASGSATSGASSAATAATKASEASTSATNAANSASAASTSATNAANSASSASTSATNASTNATSAASSASAASTSATNAGTNASNASASASNAASSATLAQDWASKTSGAVSGGQFSAKYYAQQAAASAGSVDNSNFVAKSGLGNQTMAVSLKAAALSTASTDAGAGSIKSSTHLFVDDPTEQPWTDGGVVQSRAASLFLGRAGDAHFNTDAYHNSGWKYQNSGRAASSLLLFGGDTIVRTAPSGTAGNALSWTTRWTFQNAGHLIAGADNSYDIGASGANRPRTLHVGTSVIIGGNTIASMAYRSKATVAQIRAFGDAGVTADGIAAALAPVALAYAASVAIDWSAGVFFTLTASGNVTLGAPTNVTPGSTRILYFLGDNATARTLAYATVFKGQLPAIADATSTKGYAITMLAIASDHIVPVAVRALG